MKKLLCAGILATAFGAVSAAAVVGQSSYVVGGPADTLVPSSGAWAWNRSQFEPLREALADVDNFGPTGTVPVRINTKDLGVINATAMQTIDCLVMPYVADADLNSAEVDAAIRFFLTGGDLVLLCDDSSHDEIAAALGLAIASGTTETDFRGHAPYFRGPFGTAGFIQGFAAYGTLTRDQIVAQGGRAAVIGAHQEIVGARWNRGDYAPRAGALTILTDTDFLSAISADFSPLDDNGRFALNLFAQLATRERTCVVGGPDSILTPASGAYAWDGGFLFDGLRDALEDTTRFSSEGVSPLRVHTESLTSLHTSELLLLDAYCTGLWSDLDLDPNERNALIDSFEHGLDLFVLSNHQQADELPEGLGIAVSNDYTGDSASVVWPFDDGPFGTSVDLDLYGIGRLDSANISQNGGYGIALSPHLQTMAAYFPPQQYSEQSGAMFLCGDVDAIAESRADYSAMNENAIFTLNMFDYLLSDRQIKVGGPAASANSGSWSWTGAYFADLRDALEGSFWFGPNRILRHKVKTVDVDTFDWIQLRKLDLFVTSYWADASMSDHQRQELTRSMECGGNLLITQDGPNHDKLGEHLGFPTTSASPVSSIGGAPLFDGPAGLIDRISGYGAAGELETFDIWSRGGAVAGTNDAGDMVTAAIWNRGAYGRGCGRMVVLTDTDMIASTEADYVTYNDNARFSINCFAWLLGDGCGSIRHYGRGWPGAGGFEPTLRMSGCLAPESYTILEIANATGGASGVLFIGTGRTSIPFNGCEFLVSSTLLTVPFGLLGSTGVPGVGRLSLGFAAPPGVSGLQLNMQAFVIDAAATEGLASSDGLEFQFD